MSTTTELLIDRLKEARKKINGISCLIGFDGYVDRIIRVVKSSRSPDDHTYFSTIEEFAAHLQSSSGKSADMRTITQETRVGGNAPILASALASFGMKATCIGALGDPVLNPVFTDFPPGCRAIGIGEPGMTDAFEFDDGKLMFGNISGFDRISWETLKSRIGLESLVGMVRSSTVIGVVNWSSLYGTESILTGFLEEVFPQIDAESLREKYLVIDLADPSARSKDALASLIEVLSRFSDSVRIAICLNEKEARILSSFICHTSDKNDLVCICESLYNKLSPSVVQIHAIKGAVGMDANGVCRISGTFVEKPNVTTGGGDNFNAGFAAGLALGFSLRDSLVMGNAAAAFYVVNGKSPDLGELSEFIKIRMEQGDYEK